MARLPSAQNRRDTVPKSNPPNQRPPSTENQNDETQPHRPYVTIDANKPVPVETPTYIRSVLRMQRIYVNNDAIELMQILNPQLAGQQTVMSDTKLVLPVFPEPDSKNNRAINQQFKIDADPDNNVNNEFARKAATTDSLVNIFNSIKFDIDDVRDQKYLASLKTLLPALVDLNKKAIDKIRHTSRATVSTLTIETTALNNVLTNSTTTSTISGENVRQLYSLLVDINILLSGITDRKLQIPGQSDQGSNLQKVPFSFASYHANILPPKAEKISSSDDDPRKFNIYIFRKSLAQNGKQNPELKAYSISYAIPALADDQTQWSTIPEPASTVHCYFPPARFNFTITDINTNEVYSATEDLFDAQKDPNERWTILDLLDRHPTYRLIFLIP
ncbi:MAG: hypothetical protein ABI358_08070 [Ginsengibacter sp.]